MRSSASRMEGELYFSENCPQAGLRHLVPNLSLMNDTTNDIYFVSLRGHSEDSNGYYYVTASWVRCDFSRFVVRLLPLRGDNVIHIAHHLIEVDNHHGHREIYI